MRTATLVLEHDQLHVVSDRGTMHTLAWEPLHPERVSDAVSSLLQTNGGLPKSLVLVVGLAFLEAALPGLPPVSPDVRQRMLLADPQRFFVADGAVAVAIDGTWAFACDSAMLQRWWQAFSAVASIRAVLALPTAVRMLGLTGAWTVPSAPGETGAIAVSSQGIADVRRARGSTAKQVDTAAGKAAGKATPLDLAACARLLNTGATIALDDQLLDAALRERLAGRDRARFWRAATLAATGALLLAWALSFRQARTIAALETEQARLETLSHAPRAAQSRLMSALQEQGILDESARETDAHTSLPAALARLGAIVPGDAFVQRLEWNGQRWRIDGSASDASRLLPLLDADSAIADVQSLAPSTRFMDGGRPRSSFSIGFRMSGTPVVATNAIEGATP